MEERSHFGLDEDGANRVRRILIRQIEKTESELQSQPAPATSWETEVFNE